MRTTIRARGQGVNELRTRTRTRRLGGGRGGQKRRQGENAQPNHGEIRTKTRVRGRGVTKFEDKNDDEGGRRGGPRTKAKKFKGEDENERRNDDVMKARNRVRCQMRTRE